MNYETEVKTIRIYKDTVFRMLFKEPEKLLELYNAVSGGSYTDASQLELVTLENAVRAKPEVSGAVPNFEGICSVCGLRQKI